ncbi:MAG: RHS repeat-associated core domain-containing protein [Cytophagia bacterium]|nr:RHS repeat-associated core domain-containing protein [Cytophagia bacterium]
MITKRVPGGERVDMVYDKLDRLVATQDGNLRDQSKWQITKYDAHNRPVITGLYYYTSDRAALQTVVDSWNNDIFVRTEAPNTTNVVEGVNITISQHVSGTIEYRVKNGGFITFLPGFDSGTDEFETTSYASLSHEYTFYQGYYDASFPIIDSNVEVLTVGYFDNYNFTSESYDDNQEIGFHSAGTDNAVNPAVYTNAKGLPTGSKVKVLGSSDDWLTTVMFYDDRGRVIQTVADNHLGGKDISTTQYDFSGKVLNTYTVHNNPQASGSDAQTTIAKRFDYESSGTGRLLSIEQKINGTGAYERIVTNEYDAMGQLVTKKLGDETTPLEILDYEYNVRGWLKGINTDELGDADNGNPMSSHYFAMELFYDWGFTQNQLNGNIAGVKWKTTSSDQIRAYGFDYDASNRLGEAEYSQGSAWSNSLVDFSTSYGYDANGNITALTREGMVAGTKETIDNLSYTYLNSGKSNQLAFVDDSEGDFGQGDFVDGNTGTDYSYDLNGNLTQDLNKGISAGNITYNHLNLPQTITFSGNRSITYTYDAAGIKLSKTVNNNGSISTTDYVTGFIYENDELQHFAHEEGRIRKSGSSLVKDYFIKDHLGNTRMTLTEARDSTVYDATMETTLAWFEEDVFLNIPSTRNDTYAFEGSYSAKVGPESVGPGKMLVVSAGDTVDLSVWARYSSSFSSTGSGSSANIAIAIASMFGTNGGGASTYEQNTYNLLNTNSGSFLASIDDTGSSSVPKAYLNYILFDQDFNLVQSVSGYQKVDSGSEDAFDEVTMNGLVMPEGGFLYVYLSNEGTTSNGGDVYFDVLRINHKKGAIIQEDHYYPFGLSISALSSTAPLSKPNNFKYNGFEEQTDFDLGWYDYSTRFYNPELGRFMQVDPAADLMRRHSPYNYAFDNPIRFIDPDGMMPEDRVSQSDPIVDLLGSGYLKRGASSRVGNVVKNPILFSEGLKDHSTLVENSGSFSRSKGAASAALAFLAGDSNLDFAPIDKIENTDVVSSVVFSEDGSQATFSKTIINTTVELSAGGIESATIETITTSQTHNVVKNEDGTFELDINYDAKKSNWTQSTVINSNVDGSSLSPNTMQRVDLARKANAKRDENILKVNITPTDNQDFFEDVRRMEEQIQRQGNHGH